MDFYINQSSTLPILKLELIRDGRYSYKEFHDLLQNSDITFTMTDIVTGVKRIACKEALCLLKSEYNGCDDEEYYLAYKFSKKETSKSGTYIGQFNVEFGQDYGNLIVPIRNELKIHILSGSIK
jgi:hypothetical protein